LWTWWKKLSEKDDGEIEAVDVKERHMIMGFGDFIWKRGRKEKLKIREISPNLSTYGALKTKASPLLKRFKGFKPSVI
jgi:hypothetical protein